MERNINKIKIFYNKNNHAVNVYRKLRKILKEYNFQIVDKDYELGIAIGGDGSFLRMIKSANYDSNIYYVGINAGTLGFLQEVKDKNLKNFIEALNANKYYIEEVGVQESIITTNDGEIKCNSLNEISIRERDLNTIFLEVKVNNHVLEKFAGDGLLIATTVGSTAYNLSFGGSIVYHSLHTLQITPIAPLNSKVYRNLLNSVIIPEKTVIELRPSEGKNNTLISIDGENRIVDNVESILTSVGNKKLKFIRFEDYNFCEKVNDKFLSN
jgi:NAD+ kinase